MNINTVLKVDHQPETVGFSTDRLRRLNPLLQGYIERGQLPGIVATIARQGQTVYYEKFGWLDIADQQPMQDDAIFMIASMTKPITAVAAMMLYEEGHFHLNTPISEFIPAFKDTTVYAGKGPQGGIYLDDLEREITFRYLFTHTSGLSYGWDENDPVDRLYQEVQVQYADSETPFTNRMLAEGLAQLPLAFQPGTHWRYSLSIDMLGALVEIISGMPFEQFLQQRVFDPLGMADTGFWVPAEKRERLATVYGDADPEKGLQALGDVAPPAELPSFTSGGGGLCSTIQDYARFAQMLVNAGELNGQRLLGPKTVALFSLNQCPVAALPYGFDAVDTYHLGYGYSLGTRVLMDVAQSGLAGSVGEFGWDGKFRTYFWVDPQEDLYGVFMTQLDAAAHYPVHQQFKQLTYQAMI